MIYTTEIVVAIVENMEYIEAFLEKTTSELFQCYYEYPDSPEFWQAEGNTLQDRGPHNTRIPKLDNLKENLIVMKADVEKALKQLDLPEEISVIYHYQFAPPAANRRIQSKILAAESIEKMVEWLNRG